MNLFKTIRYGSKESERKLKKQLGNPYHQTVRAEMFDFLPQEYSKVLEIGCNVGNFRQLLNKSCEYWGVEPLEEAAEIAKTKLDKVLTGSYEKVESEIPDNYFDLVIANDVIEHLENPWNFLQSIRKKMRNENSSIVLSIPNIRYLGNLKELLIKKDWEYKESGILDITHLRFFTKKSMIRLLKECGFEIEKIEGINSIIYRKLLLPLYYLIKFTIGSDTIFYQYGIRAKPKKNSSCFLLTAYCILPDLEHERKA